MLENPSPDKTASENPTETTETNPPAALPEIPENEHEPTKDISAQAGIIEKIRLAGSAAVEKFNVVRRGRGRPRNDGSPKKSDVVQPENLEAGPGGGSPAADISDPAVAAAENMPDFKQEIDELFRRCVASSAKGVTEGCNFVTKILANQAGISPEFTEKTLASAKPEPDALADFSAAVDLVVKKHRPQIKEGGEWACLAMTTGRLMAPYALVWLEFKKEIERRKNSGN
ncbi:MAG TPA: hypothetical protein VK742_08300 [Candidatus Sulfotelmatobacter sp.]|jgi:hypothetical protein|nr:hypothetical protein [Candidatus Sulfotelmatobacter sp.]